MSTTTESATTEVTTKEGVEIKGKDVIKLTAPEILPPAGQLLTNAQDIVGAINELFSSGTGAAYNGNFRAVIDDDSGAITIVVGENPEDMEEEQYSDYSYSYTAVEWSDKIVTNTETAEGTVTTTQNFSKTVITELYNANGKLIMRADYNADTGVVNGYYDGDGVQIHLAEWRL